MAEPATPARAGLARSLGEFVGHIWRAVRHDPAPTTAKTRRVLRHEVQEEHRDAMVLRRTTIEEIELRGSAQPHEPAPSAPPWNDRPHPSPPSPTPSS